MKRLRNTCTTGFLLPVSRLCCFQVADIQKGSLNTSCTEAFVYLCQHSLQQPQGTLEEGRRGGRGVRDALESSSEDDKATLNVWRYLRVSPSEHPVQTSVQLWNIMPRDLFKPAGKRAVPEDAERNLRRTIRSTEESGRKSGSQTGCHQEPR